MSEAQVIHNSTKNASNVVRSAARRVFGTAEQKIRKVFNDLRRKGHSSVQPFSVGHVERRMREFAAANSIELAEGDMYMSVKGITHARRGTKIRSGKAVSEKAIARFPKNRNTMDLYYDGKVFVYTNYKNKFIVHPNYELKMEGGKVRKVNFVTASKAGRDEFNLPKYRKI